ncbi:MAG TPA: hypothetical protein VGE27_15930 [Gemmatimonas sp.]|uniref:hypothetical protein n=1 Tax=Gemmatimonas sp. TaxID=1962908 RepID=UPI002EDA3313
MDSSGVKIVSFDSLPVADGPLRLESRPWLQLGGLHENDSLEFDARGFELTAAELASGEIVVGDHQRLKYFQRSGKLLHIVGRAGHGPGEFTPIRQLCAQSDSTLSVIDFNGRWSQWDRAGNHRRTTERLGLVPFYGCSPDGTMLAQRADLSAPTPSSSRRRLLDTKVYGRDGAVVHDLGALSASEVFSQLFYDPGFALTAQSVIVGDPRTFEVRSYDLDRRVVTAMWRVKNALRPLTTESWDSLVQSSIPSNNTPANRQQMVAVWTRIGKPDAYPAFWRLHRDSASRIWLGVYFDTRRQIVLDVESGRLSRLTIPIDAKYRPSIAGFTSVGPIVRHFDDDGAVRLSFYRVVDNR